MPIVPAAKPDPFTVSVPGVPVTPVAEPPFAIKVYVPAASALVVVTVTGALFKANAPADAPVTVSGAVLPPPYAVNASPPADKVIPLPLATVIVPVVVLPVAEALNF